MDITANPKTALSHHNSRGRHAKTPDIIDLNGEQPSVVHGRPATGEFLRQTRDEMRIRFYRSTTIKSYLHAAGAFLRWLGHPPHRATRADVREYLLSMVESGADSGTVSNHLSAIRLLFDRFCNRDITFGLMIPRRPKRKPSILGKQEIVRLLQAATSLRDKLILGLLYATGMRISEIAKLRWNDFDFERNSIMIRRGKGQADRVVVLPDSYREILRSMARHAKDQHHVFPGQVEGKYISPRTIQRIMKNTLRLANITKPATPHSLRHAFATHSFENGYDIRRIQKLLGHVRLETTTIYVKVAMDRGPRSFQSPLDSLQPEPTSSATMEEIASTERSPVGSMRIHLQQQTLTDHQNENRRVAKVTIEILTSDSPVYLIGTVAKELRPGFVSLDIPPKEAWQDVISRLSQQQQERVGQPEFFHKVQLHVASKLLKLPAPGTQ